MESPILVRNADVSAKEWHRNNRDNHYGIDETSVKHVSKLLSIGLYFAVGSSKISLFNVCDCR